jgi:hypothetical protein
MKQKSEKKLSLNKITIRDLQPGPDLGNDELMLVKGGKIILQSGTTMRPVYC